MYGSDAQPDRSARSEVGVTHTVAPGGEARGPARIAVVGAGPAGLYALQTYGSNLLWVFVAILAAWVVAPLGVAYVRFLKRGDF